MSYVAQCANCGDRVVFEFDDSVVRVCPSCRSLLVRKGASIENAGIVGEVASTGSVLRLGEMGSFDGRSFQVVGRVQVEHASGLWDEWRLLFGDGGHGWIAESLGRRHILLDREAAGLLTRAATTPGVVIDSIGMRVTDIGTVKAVTLEGELPQEVRPGMTWHYADLAGPNGSFGTIDFGDGDEAEALFEGREVSLKDVGLGHLGRETHAPKADAQALQCPQCGGALSLRAPDQSQSIACPYCGTLSAIEGDLRAIDVPKKKKEALTFKPRFPLGAKARLDGVTWIVLGAMERSVMEIYTWREYLLHHPAKGFAWLVEDRGHWCFVVNAHAGDVSSGTDRMSYQGVSYRHFTTGSARVDSLVGEFPWAVRRGETVDASDYVAPPLVLSEERTKGEVTYSLGRYMERAEIEDAFGMRPGVLPPPIGVHCAQPNPHAERTRQIIRSAAMFIAAIFVLFLLANARSSKVFEANVAIPPGAGSGSPEATFISAPFDLKGRGNVEVTVSAPINNQWLFVEGTLAKEDTAVYGDFETEAGFYHGTADGEGWTEGSTSARTFVGGMPAGRYTLRISPQWGAIAPGKPVLSSYSVRVRHRVPHFSHFGIAILALTLWPVLCFFKRANFETQRWAESDHAE